MENPTNGRDPQSHRTFHASWAGLGCLGAWQDHKASQHPKVDQKAPSSTPTAVLCQMPLNLWRSFCAGALSETEDDGRMSPKLTIRKKAVSLDVGQPLKTFQRPFRTSRLHACQICNVTTRKLHTTRRRAVKSRWGVLRSHLYLVCDAKGYRPFSTQRRTAKLDNRAGSDAVTCNEIYEICSTLLS